MPSRFARSLALLVAVSSATSIGPAHAQDAASPTANAALPQPCAEPCLRAGTLVELEIGEALSSATRKRGDKFTIKLYTALAQAGTILIPAGTVGVGEIIHADRSRGGGKPGELLIAARYLQLGDTQVPLHGLKFGGQGQDRSGAALGLSFAVGPFAQFVHGREIEIPAGTIVTAKLAQDFPLAGTGTLSATPATPEASITSATSSDKE